MPLPAPCPFGRNTTWHVLALFPTAIACTQTGPHPLSRPLSVTERAPIAPPTHHSDPTPTFDLTPEILRTCIATPRLTTHPGCAWRGAWRDSAVPAVCGNFAPENSRDVEVLSVLVATAPFDFAGVLGIPSMQTFIDANSPNLAPMKSAYHELEGPHLTLVEGGRHAKVEGRSAMLGGVVHWATLPSPNGTFDTVVVRYVPLHDSPLADSDRKSIEGWDLVAIATCIDSALWPNLSDGAASAH